MAGADFALDPHYLNERVFKEDYARVYLFYFQRGFREVVVDTILTRPTENEVEITFQIQEGDPIRVVHVDFQGVEDLPDSSVLEDLPVRVGDPHSLPALVAVRDTVETRLRNQGFAYPWVGLDSANVPNGGHEAQLFFKVDAGPLSEFGSLDVDFIETRGADPTLEEAVVLRMLPFKEGDPYRENLRFEGRRALYNLDIFRLVNDTVTSFHGDSVLDLRVRVAEGDVHRVRTGGGFSTAECIDLEASWSSLNFMGGARRLQITGRIANVLASPLRSTLCSSQGSSEEFRKPIGSVSVDFTQPYFYSPRNSLSARLFAERQSYPDVFIREAVGMSFGFTRTLAPFTFVGFSYRPQFSKLDLTDVLFCSAYLICDRTEIDLLADYNFLSPLGISFSQDRRNQVLSPTRGHSVAVDVEHARKWTGSEFGYTRVLSEASWYGQTRGRLVIGAHLRGGWVNSKGYESFTDNGLSGDILHPEKRLFAGGTTSERGFAQNRLGLLRRRGASRQGFPPST